MNCQQLFGEFLSEHPEYNEDIRYQDGVPVIGWSGLGVFLSWLQQRQYSSSNTEFFPW